MTALTAVYRSIDPVSADEIAQAFAAEIRFLAREQGRDSDFAARIARKIATALHSGDEAVLLAAFEKIVDAEGAVDADDFVNTADDFADAMRRRVPDAPVWPRSADFHPDQKG